MTNLLETARSVFSDFIDEKPTPPLHLGEAMSCWTLYTLFAEGHMMYEVGLHTSSDLDLLNSLESILKASEADIKILKEFMIQEGIPLPQISASKPKSDPQSVPFGVKFTDEEVANIVIAKLAAVITLAGATLAEALRTDFSIMILKFFTHVLEYSAIFKNLLRKKGWLKVPPSYYAPGSPI